MLTLSVVTPEGQVHTQSVDEVTVPGLLSGTLTGLRNWAVSSRRRASALAHCSSVLA